MPASLAQHLGVIAVTCLIIGGCGSKPTEAAPGTKASNSATAQANTDSESSTSKGTTDTDSGSSASSGGSFDCGQYAAGGVDYMSQSASYLFIGDHPMCTEKDKVKQFCDSIRTRDGFLLLESTTANAEAAPGVAAALPEDARGGWLESHPKHAFEKSMEKCGLNAEQIRSQLAVEAEAALKAGGQKDADVNFLVEETPPVAGALWKRECAGHLIEKDVGESIDWDFNGNQAYKFFCKSATNYDDLHNLKFKGPAAH